MSQYYIFSKKIIHWYKEYAPKNLPWQNNQTIYSVWLSEIMLQQTQVKTVIPYYKKFIKHFPTLIKLAQAELDEILYLWSGLGYYARARNLYKSAKIITENYNNKFPEDFKTLISLPGIGKSTAGAILSLSLNQKYPILDGNVKRIITRYYSINSTKNNKNLWILSEKLLPNTEISIFNQAIMNFGQLICTNKAPKCKKCPVHENCKNFSKKTINTTYPQIFIKKIIEKKIWLLLLLKQKKIIWLEQRLKYKIWKKLFCFPEFSSLEELNTWLLKNSLDKNTYKNLTILKHKLSNIHLNIQPILLHLNTININFDEKNGIWCYLKNFPKIGIPKPITTILQQLTSNEIIKNQSNL